MRFPSVLVLVPEMSGCSLWRALWPITELQSRGYPCGWAWSNDEKVADVVGLFDMIVYPRQAWLDPVMAQEFMRLAHGAGKIIVGEYDDDVWVARSDQKDHKELGYDREEATPEQNRESLQFMDGATVTTPRLAATIASFAPNYPVYVVPNYIDINWWNMMTAGWERSVPKDQVTIGWAGGNRYDADVSALAESWSEIANKYDDVGFVIQGYQPENLVNSVPLDRLYQIEFLPITGANDKPSYPVGLLNIDIGCCSVAPTMFNAAKTPIKVLEYTCSGAAVVGTDWLYGSVIDNRKTGMIANTADEWTEALSSLIEKPKLRKKLHKHMAAKVRTEYDLKLHVNNWVKAWMYLYSQGVANLTTPRRVLVPGIDD